MMTSNLQRLCLTAIASLSIVAHAQQGPIEPTWVYVTPLHWKHAPAGIPESSAAATVVVFYPEGQYLEVTAYLMRRDRNSSATLSAGDGTLIRSGTWARTDDLAIRVHSRDVWGDPETVSKIKCSETPEGKRCGFEAPHPGPYTDDTCGLEGRSATHLAQTIHCHRLIVSAAKLQLDLHDLELKAADAKLSAAVP